MTSSTNSFLSFLDLICCTFGGAVLLFLLASMSASPEGEERSGLVVIRCQHVQGPRAEIGLEYKAPGAREWSRPRRGDTQSWFFSAASEDDSGAEALLLMTAPRPGKWAFRPYLVNFARKAKVQGPLQVRFEAMGENVKVEENQPNALPMHLPGEPGQEFFVFFMPK